MRVYFTAHVCSPDRFRSQNHKCIRISLRCNGYYNCADGSDEKHCRGTDVFNFAIFSNVYLMLNLNRIDTERFAREQATICLKLLSFDDDVLLQVADNVVLHIVKNIVNNDVLP